MTPVVSVVVISDYASGQETGWNDLRRALAALAQQDFREPTEFLLSESAELTPQIPRDLLTMLPSLRVVESPATSSYALKNEVVQAASAELVAMLDGDCTPDPGWLRHLVTVMRQHPEVAVVSGRTTYGAGSLLHRAMALISRAYVDEGDTAHTRHISNNNAGFRRSIFLAHPLPTNAGPYASMLQAEAMLKDGQQLLFEPHMRVVHAYEGWTTEKNIRRSLGYGVIRTRRLDRRMPYAWMAHLGYLSIPLFVVLRMLHSWWHCARRARHYGVAWYELPAAFALAGAACTLEIPGMLRALRDEPAVETAFR